MWDSASAGYGRSPKWPPEAGSLQIQIQIATGSNTWGRTET